MGLLDTLLNPNNASALSAIAGQLGVNPEQAKAAVAGMLPALSGGMKKNASTPEGLGGLLNALSSGNHQQYIDNPRTLGTPESIADGNAILGHLLGGKDASRQLAGNVAGQTGLDSGILKKMLPMVAAMAMGGMSKQAGSSGMLNGLSSGQAPDGVGAMLAGFLDADKDGSVVDDLMGMAKKLF